MAEAILIPTSMFDRTDHTRTTRARRANVCRALVVAVLMLGSAVSAAAATHRSANFVVTASSDATAQQVAEVAEEYRLQFAEEWLGKQVPDWERPCQITVEERPTGGEGWFTYETYRGREQKLTIRIRGQLEHLVEYVLPHEVAHATLTVSIGRPAPRWADEGVALLSEPENERARQRKTAVQLAKADRLMPLDEVLQLVDYPEDRRQLIGFYASSFSLTEYLVARGGKQRLLDFVFDGDQYGWEESVRRHYDADLRELEREWRCWKPGRRPERSVEVAVNSQEDTQSARRDEDPTSLNSAASQLPSAKGSGSGNSRNGNTRSGRPASRSLR